MNKIIKSIFTFGLSTILLSACASTNASTNTNYTVGIIQFAEHSSLDNCRTGFIEGLKEAGFEDGKNIKIEYKNSQSDFSNVNTISQNFVADKVDLICAIATPAAQSAYNAAIDSNIPVVMTAVSDPVAAGLAEALDKPNKGITGTSDIIPAHKQLELIRNFLPEAKTIGILYSTGEVNSEVQIDMYKEVAGEYGFTIETAGVSNQSEIPMALDTLLSKVDCLNNLTDNTVVSALTTILDKANEKNIPVFGSEEEQVKNGCVASEGLDYVELGKKTGQMAARILNGEAAESIAIEAIEQSSPIINKSSLEKLDLTLPDNYTNVRYVGE